MELQVNLKIAFILLVFLFLIFPTLMLVVFFKHKKVLKILGIISFVLYCACMSLLVFGSVSISNGLATLTLKTNSSWFSLNFIWAEFGKTNVLYNLVMLFPVAAFVFSQTEKKTFLKTLLTFLLKEIVFGSLAKGNRFHHLYAIALPFKNPHGHFLLETKIQDRPRGFFYSASLLCIFTAQRITSFTPRASFTAKGNLIFV